MVQYVFNPWRNRREMLLVRQHFYGGDGGAGEGSEEKTTTARRRRRHRQQSAVARVSMWMARGHCPHMAESTALLVAAMLSDEAAAADPAPSSIYAVRAAYAAAFSRFVTGLLDGRQDKLRKQSMYAVAKTIGLPATFVELRHQATHEQLPPLAKLRTAADKALAWIWDYYWKNLDQADGPSGDLPDDPCRHLVLCYLRGPGDDESTRQTVTLLGRWPASRVRETLSQLQATLPGNQIYLRCLKLSRELSTAPSGYEAGAEDREREVEPVPVTSETPVSVADSCTTAASLPAWSLYQGPWKPRPIGTVDGDDAEARPMAGEGELETGEDEV